MLYVELDKADPILDDLLAGLSNKQPKIVASTLAALTALYHAYGVKVIEPKPALKALPKVFGHADKNVRAEAQNLAVELYRWLREAMKTLFWNDLKPVQQGDLEKLFETIKSEPPPKQGRLLRSQQAAAEQAAAVAEDDGGASEEEVAEEQEVETFDLAEPVDVLKKMPSNFHDNLASAKWKERKDALDALYEAANTDRIKDGHYDEVIQDLAKSMKDANIAVVMVAASCIDVLAKGLRKSFAKYRGRVMPPVLEKLKEKKTSVADALGQALDSIVASSSLSDCLEDILEFLKHKNPNVKSETLKLLIRCLKTTRDAPTKPETKAIADSATKLLTESTESTRAGGAEVLGTVMKIMGERAMAPYMDGLDDIRKTKIKEYCDAAVVKAKDKPKPVAPPSAAAPTGQKRPPPKKVAPGTKPPVKRASTPQSEKPSSSPGPYSKSATSRPIASKLGNLPKSSLAPPGSKKKLPGAGAGSAPALHSPRRTITPHSEDDSHPAPKYRGLAGRPLGKPAPTPASPPARSAPSGLEQAERAELDDLRADQSRAQRNVEDLRSEKTKYITQIHELQNQNAQLIEDHTRDVLSIKAKETQLVRARSDAEAAEGMVQRLQRENERLKRELSRSVRSSAGDAGGSPSPALDDTAGGIYRDRDASGGRPGVERGESAYSSSARQTLESPSEEKENGGLEGGIGKGKDVGGRGGGGKDESGKPAENWQRAAEVTSQLKARIEQMKVCLPFLHDRIFSDSRFIG